MEPGTQFWLLTLALILLAPPTVPASPVLSGLVLCPPLLASAVLHSGRFSPQPWLPLAPWTPPPASAQPLGWSDCAACPVSFPCLYSAQSPPSCSEVRASLTARSGRADTRCRRSVCVCLFPGAVTPHAGPAAGLLKMCEGHTNGRQCKLCSNKQGES